jgi:hypothetical protein
MRERLPEKIWFPFWSDKWLWGSIRIELDPAERGIWVDMLALAAKDNGHIRANEETPYPLHQLAGMLIVDKELLEKTIEKFIELDKMERDKYGCLHIKKWEKYQFSERHQRRLIKEHSNREMSANPATVSGKKDTITYNNKEYNNKEYNNKEEKKSSEVKKKITFSFDSRKWENITEKDIEVWQEAYPACDIWYELKKMKAWLLANPKKRKKQYTRFINNWLSRAQDKGGSRGVRPQSAEDEDLKHLLRDKG